MVCLFSRFVSSTIIFFSICKTVTFHIFPLQSEMLARHYPSCLANVLFKFKRLRIWTLSFFSSRRCNSFRVRYVKNCYRYCWASAVLQSYTGQSNILSYLYFNGVPSLLAKVKEWHVKHLCCRCSKQILWDLCQYEMDENDEILTIFLFERKYIAIPLFLWWK